MGQGVGRGAVGAWVFDQGDELGDGAVANKRNMWVCSDDS